MPSMVTNSGDNRDISFLKLITGPDYSFGNYIGKAIEELFEPYKKEQGPNNE